MHRFWPCCLPGAAAARLRSTNDRRVRTWVRRRARDSCVPTTRPAPRRTPRGTRNRSHSNGTRPARPLLPPRVELWTPGDHNPPRAARASGPLAEATTGRARRSTARQRRQRQRDPRETAGDRDRAQRAGVVAGERRGARRAGMGGPTVLRLGGRDDGGYKPRSRTPSSSAPRWCASSCRTVMVTCSRSISGSCPKSRRSVSRKMMIWSGKLSRATPSPRYSP